MMQFFADGIVLFHVGFVLFVVFGGLLVLRWRRVIWAHVPAVAWGALLELFDWICPLTPLENEFRRRAGQAGYEEGFIEHYVLPLLYPVNRNAGVRIALGIMAIAMNVLIYSWVFRQLKWSPFARKRSQPRSAGTSESG